MIQNMILLLIANTVFGLGFDLSKIFSFLQGMIDTASL